MKTVFPFRNVSPLMSLFDPKYEFKSDYKVKTITIFHFYQMLGKQSLILVGN